MAVEIFRQNNKFFNGAVFIVGEFMTRPVILINFLYVFSGNFSGHLLSVLSSNICVRDEILFFQEKYLIYAHIILRLRRCFHSLFWFVFMNNGLFAVLIVSSFIRCRLFVIFILYLLTCVWHKYVPEGENAFEMELSKVLLRTKNLWKQLSVWLRVRETGV